MAPVIEIEVRALTNFAFVAGVTVDRAEHILLEADSWRYPQMPCHEELPNEGECGTQPHVVVDEAWDGRTMLYCTNCGTVDLWV